MSGEGDHNAAVNDIVDSLLDATASTMDAFDEEVLVSRRIAESRLREEQKTLERAKDDIKFREAQVAEREKVAEASRTELVRLRRQVQMLNGSLADKDGEVADLSTALSASKSQCSILERKLAAASSELATLVQVGSTPSTPTASSSSFPPKFASGSSASVSASCFSTMQQDKRKIIHLSRENKALKKQLSATCASLEATVMAGFDRDATMDHFQPIMRRSSLEHKCADPASPDMAGQRRGGSVITYAGVKRNGRTSALSLPFKEPLDLRGPEETYMNSRIPMSDFEAPMDKMRTKLHEFVKEWKTMSDTSLSSMWFIFNDRERKGGGLLSNPKEDFFKETRSFMDKSKSMMFELLRRTNGGMKDIMLAEKKVKDDWLKKKVNWPRCSVGVTADIPPEEDPRIFTLEQKLDYVNAVLQSARDTHREQIRGVEEEKTKSEVNMMLLQHKTVQLHNAAFSAMHGIYRHRFRFAPRLPDSMRALAPLLESKTKRAELLKVGFNTKVAQAVDTDIGLLQALEKYFISDEIFGSDMSSAAMQDTPAAPARLRQRRGSASDLGSGSGAHAARKLQDIVRTMIAKERGEKEKAKETENKEPPAKQRTPKTAALSPRNKNVLVLDTKAADEKRKGSEGRASVEVAPPPPSSKAQARPRRASTPTQFSEFTRMKEWQDQQSALWEKRRQSINQESGGIYVIVDEGLEDGPAAPLTAPSGSLRRVNSMTSSTRRDGQNK